MVALCRFDFCQSSSYVASEGLEGAGYIGYFMLLNPEMLRSYQMAKKQFMRCNAYDERSILYASTCVIGATC